MKNKGVFTKLLAIVGTILAWFPILAPFLISVTRFFEDGIFRFDYLMPAELFPFALGGGLLLLWAALRAKTRVKLIGWGLGAAIFLLVSSQALAMLTGLASGATDPVGWVYIIVLSALIAYALALVVVAVGGAQLLKDVFNKKTE
jgi:hypothetical protein